MQVVSADGINVQPLMVDKIELATAETYDVLIQMPEDSTAYEFRATSWDVTGHGSVFLGNGPEVNAPSLPKLNYFAMMREMNDMMGSMDMSGGGMNMKNMNEMKGMNSGGHDMKGMEKTNKKDTAGMQGMNMGNMNMPSEGNMPGMFMPMAGGDGMMLSYDMLRSINPSTLDSTKKFLEINLTLTGNMLRYIWSFDNKTLSEADEILIRRGENGAFFPEKPTPGTACVRPR